MEDQPESYDEALPAETAREESWRELQPTLPPFGILAGLSDESLANLASYGQYQSFPAGTQLITEGETQDRFYIVVSGTLGITATAAGKDVHLSLAEAGECLGEVSLLEPGPASASARVVEEAILWSMDLNDLRRYLTEHPGGGGALLMGMAHCLSQRIRQTNRLISQHHTLLEKTYPNGMERAITAENTPVNLSFFDRIKRSLTGEKKVKISTEIKL